jgi:hypothetical protein
MKRYIALFILLAATLGLAHAIEVTARPETGREGRVVGGETQGGGMPPSAGGHTEGDGHNH